MRLRNTFLWVLSGASAFAAIGCGDSGGGKADPSNCDGASCDDAGTGGDSSVADPRCANGKKDGSETDVDCGGSCEACADGAGCEAADDCTSAVCTDSACAAPACDDTVQNGDETDVDCGGSCDSCDPPASCSGDCPPSPGFTVATSGSGPTTAIATSGATRGSDRIAQTRYDWGDGTGSGTAASHDYDYAGAYVVTQTVIDAAGRIATATQTVDVAGGFAPVRMSSTDLSRATDQAGKDVPGIALHDNGFVIEVRGMEASTVRSDAAVAPGSGVFYFEGERLHDQDPGFWGFGVATADAPLEPVMGPAALGSSAASFGLYTQGTVTTNAYAGNGFACAGIPAATGVSVNPANTHYGFVVDYRGTTPIVYIVAKEFPEDEKPSVRCAATLTGITKPLFIMFAGFRTAVGPQARVNTGADTVNQPFAYAQDDVAAAVDAVAAGTSASLVLGFKGSHSRAASTAPTLDVPAAASVALGSAVTLTASASDAEEGDLTNKIEWVDRPTAYHFPTQGYGGSFTFTPKTLGKHKIALSVTDSAGVRTTGEVVVTVTGALEQFTTVQLASDLPHGERALATTDGLGVYFQADGHFKDGMRVNQGLYGDFWYFEANRGTGYDSMGIGLVGSDADLNPYNTHDTPWSMSVNVTAGVWRDLNNIGNLAPGSALGEFTAGMSINRYGFAVDYRGESPVVHVIVGTGATGKLVGSVPMPHVFGPVHPFVYSGNGELGTAAAPAVTLDFTPPFGFDARTILQAANDVVTPLTPADAAALKLGWGAANTR